MDLVSTNIASCLPKTRWRLSCRYNTSKLLHAIATVRICMWELSISLFDDILLAFIDYIIRFTDDYKCVDNFVEYIKKIFVKSYIRYFNCPSILNTVIIYRQCNYLMLNFF